MFISTGKKISTVARRWRRKSRTCSTRKRKPRKKRSRTTRAAVMLRRKNLTRKRRAQSPLRRAFRWEVRCENPNPPHFTRDVDGIVVVRGGGAGGDGASAIGRRCAGARGVCDQGREGLYDRRSAN